MKKKVVCKTSKRRTVAAPKRGGPAAIPWSASIPIAERRRREKFIKEMMDRANLATPEERAQADRDFEVLIKAVDGDRRRAGARTVFSA